MKIIGDVLFRNTSTLSGLLQITNLSDKWQRLQVRLGYSLIEKSFDVDVCKETQLRVGLLLFQIRRQYFQRPGSVPSYGSGYSCSFQETILIRMYAFRNVPWLPGSVHGAEGRRSSQPPIQFPFPCQRSSPSARQRGC